MRQLCATCVSGASAFLQLLQHSLKRRGNVANPRVAHPSPDLLQAQTSRGMQPLPWQSANGSVFGQA